jgi:hypothetical protein
VQVKFLLSVFCFTFHSLKPIRPRTLNIEKTWNGLMSHSMYIACSKYFKINLWLKNRISGNESLFFNEKNLHTVALKNLSHMGPSQKKKNLKTNILSNKKTKLKSSLHVLIQVLDL